ncbi:fatty acid desaturase family protein [Marinobacter sp. F3R11]|uniref:fatty acid desaturase family protein n=1 Tax=Marinobacter sp. F3R11 TaxID=2267231 RepID=UPI000DE9B28E|nr:fatty acid desaturase [Marinobacter sp. F3R11]RBW48914.1 hypothetical protein DS878_12310 [Marinobacter sp. F3R11]
MNKATYSTLRDRVRSEGLFKKNNYFSAAVVFIELSIMLALVSWLLSTEPMSISYFLAIVFIGVSAFRCFALLHECGHRAMFTSQRANTLVGYLMSPFCLIPYACWRDLHLQHHRWVGVIDKDPTQAGLIKLKEASFIKRQAFRWVWWLCIPIPSIQLIFSVFWLHPFRLMASGSKEAPEALLALIVCVLPHALLILFIGPWTYMVFILPAMLFYFFWFETVNFTHHSGLFPYTSDNHPNPIPLYEQDQVSRTSAFSKWISITLAYNFNFHTEHHYFPTVPWHNLPRVYELVQETNDLSDYHDVPFLGFSAKLRTSDPVSLYIDSLN